MKLYVMCVRDRASDVFGTPYFAVSVGSALRGFSDEINDRRDNNLLAKHPEDFDLYQLGTYDDSTGSFECGTPRQVSVGKDQIRSQ